MRLESGKMVRNYLVSLFLGLSHSGVGREKLISSILRSILETEPYIVKCLLGPYEKYKYHASVSQAEFYRFLLVFQNN